MKSPLDRFSLQAGTYKKYRPVYPTGLYSEVLQHVPERKLCWDCGTGNGQVATVLAKYFNLVEATDISSSQMHFAEKHRNIEYSVQQAELTNFSDNQFDLITVAQAVHWFDFEKFNQEARRVGKTGSVIALWGYGLLKVDKLVDEPINYFEREIVGPYWDVERKHIDSHYDTIPFDFVPIESNRLFQIEVEWNTLQLQGYFESWSCVQNYIKKNNKNPVPTLMKRLDLLWPDGETKKVTFPIFLKMGRIVK